MRIKHTRRELLGVAASLGLGGLTASSTPIPADTAEHGAGTSAEQASLRDVMSDTWVCTDSLGRTLPLRGDAPAPRRDRTVGIFYFLWHGAHGTPGPYDNSKLIAANPASPAYGPEGAFHWWGEPHIGYFRSDDPWVARHNLLMLANAGVDVVLLDATNAFTYHQEVVTMCKAAEDIAAHGGTAPKFAFITHAATAKTVADLYDFIYRPRLFMEQWFIWKGKPLILGDVTAHQDNGTPMPEEIQQFFTWRYSWAWDPGKDKWEWIDTYPQRYGWHTSPKVAEQAPAAVASHPNNDIGRSWHDGAEPPLNELFLASDRHKGIYFGLQVERLLQIDPQFALLTGWNEWVAQRFVVPPGGSANFMGRHIGPGSSFFVDNYNEEFSRDIQPMKGGYGDLYYLQMVAAIRKFKGVRTVKPAVQYHDLVLHDSWHHWPAVGPVYLDAQGDTLHRDWAGWGNLHYKNETGRNDIVEARVAANATHLWFYVKTAAPLTVHTDTNWMQLLLNTHHGDQSGWEGYDYVVNAKVVNNTTTLLRRLRDGHETHVSYRTRGHELVIEIPRHLIGVQNGPDFQFEFHWVDNVPVGEDINRFWTEGDSAPDGRFNYRYVHGII